MSRTTRDAERGRTRELLAGIFNQDNQILKNQIKASSQEMDVWWTCGVTLSAEHWYVYMPVGRVKNVHQMFPVLIQLGKHPDTEQAPHLDDWPNH
jgi:hypothetical protein